MLQSLTQDHNQRTVISNVIYINVCVCAFNYVPIPEESWGLVYFLYTVVLFTEPVEL